jgi:thiopeptide-type bacteriocin biosynthesis protein
MQAIKLEHDGYFVYRRPAMPMAFLDQLLLKHADVAPADYSGVTAALLADPRIADAIRVNSPALHTRLASGSTQQKPAAQLFSVLRYLVRMSTRATPFAAYACVGSGSISAQADANQGNYEAGDIGCSLDIDCAVLLAFDERIKKHLPRDEATRVRVASIVYAKGSSIRFIERRLGRANLNYELAKADKTAFLELTLNHLERPKTVGLLADQLAECESDVSRDDIADYLFRLLEGGVLQVDADVLLTSGHRLDSYLKVLLDAAPLAPQVEDYCRLAQLAALIGAHGRLGLHAAADLVNQAEALVKSFGMDFPSGKVLHVDSFCEAPASLLTEAHVSELSQTIAMLDKVLPKDTDTEWNDLIQSFERRFGNEFIPLMVALDPENGINCGRTDSAVKWTDGVKLGRKTGDPANFRPPSLYSTLVSESSKPDVRVLDLCSVFNYIPEQSSRLPASFTASITVFRDDPSAAAAPAGGLLARPTMLINFLTGPGATSINARFGARDAVIAGHLQKTVEREDAYLDDTIFAEVVHLPTPRHGNVSTRASIRSYELVLSGSGSVAPAFQLRPDELSIAAVGGEIILWSTRFNKRVIPRFSSAYNFNFKGNLGIYKFLCQLASRMGGGVPQFAWPAEVRFSAFLPRVVCANVVVARARWNLVKQDIDAICKAIELQAWATCTQIFTDKALPQWFAVEVGDNLLEIERDNHLSLALFRDEIADKFGVTLTESPARMGPSVLHCRDLAWHNEIVLPLHAARPAAHAREASHQSFTLRTALGDVGKGAVSRAYWHYIKLYGSEEYLAAFISGELKSLLQQAHQAGLIRRWFFIRYTDPDFHIRLRIEGARPEFGAFLSAFQQNALESRLATHDLSAYVFDNYVPEYSRYGGKALMQFVEELFFHDSNYCLTIMAAAQQQNSDELIWKAALVGALDYLGAFGLNEAEISGLITLQRSGYGAELELAKPQFDSLGLLYKKHRHYIEAALRDPSGVEPVIRHALALRSRNNASARAVVLAGTTKDGLLAILPSVLHMQANRLFSSNSRPQEFIVWDFLARAHRSGAARRNDQARSAIASAVPEQV